MVQALVAHIKAAHSSFDSRIVTVSKQQRRLKIEALYVTLVLLGYLGLLTFPTLGAGMAREWSAVRARTAPLSS